LKRAKHVKVARRAAMVANGLEGSRNG
jgi:hypothetical protein